jgi:NADH:ubiquinone oxidoreductase subunit D
LPYRLKLRPASLHTVLALSTVLQNSKRSNFEAIISSMPFISGDADR